MAAWGCPARGDGQRAKTRQVLLSSDGRSWSKAHGHSGSAFDVLKVDLGNKKARSVKLQLAEVAHLHFMVCEVSGY